MLIEVGITKLVRGLDRAYPRATPLANVLSRYR